MAKHLVDIDEQALRAARIELGTRTIKDTVNGALGVVGGSQAEELRARFDALATADLASREHAWR